MKKNVAKILIIALILTLSVPFGSFAATTGEFTIIHTNDTHSRIMADDNSIGFGVIKAEVEKLKKENPNVLLLDAGDTFHGQTFATMSQGESIVKIMNAMGYDAMTPGNHDFNYGYARLLELSKMANFPILSANTKATNGSNLLTSYIIKEIGGLKVAIFGLTTPEVATKAHPVLNKGLTFADPIAVAEAIVKELGPKTDVIIALAHMGLDASSEITSELVAKKVSGIDVIIDGHSHTVLEEGMLVGNTLIAQAGEYDKNLGVVKVSVADGKVSAKANLITKAETLETKAAVHEKIATLIKEITDGQKPILDAIAGKTDFVLNGESADVRTKMTNVGLLAVKAMIKATGADAALTNGGGIRASINAGDITKGELINVFPFGNYVVVKEVKGSDIVAAIEHGTKDYPEPAGGYPVVGNITYTLDLNKASGSRVSDVKIVGVAVDMAKLYKIALNDFNAAGGSGYTMFATAKEVGQYAGLDEILISYITSDGIKNLDPKDIVTIVEKMAVAEETVPEVVAKPDTVAITGKKYIVKTGDALWKIAKKFNITYKELANFNKIANPHFIKLGQVILIP